MRNVWGLIFFGIFLLITLWVFIYVLPDCRSNCYRAQTNTCTQLLCMRLPQWLQRLQSQQWSADLYHLARRYCRQLFSALCFYTTKHRLKCLSPPEVWVRDEIQQKQPGRKVDAIWSGLKRKKKLQKKNRLKYGNELLGVFAKQSCRENNARIQVEHALRFPRPGGWGIRLNTR